MPVNKLAVAFTGTGDVKDANVAALLDNHLPASLSGVYLPERITRGQAGLKTVVQWLEDEGLEAERSDSLLDDLQVHVEKGHDVQLIVVGTEGSEDLIAEAHKRDFPVKDLSKALYDVLPVADEPEVTYQLPAKTQVQGTFTATEVAALKKFAAFLLSVQGTAASVSVDSPPFDPPYVDKTKAEKPVASEQRPGTKPYFVTEDGSIRPARGRKKNEETKAYLTDEEAEAYAEANS
jgi:hypothetical protein